MIRVFLLDDHGLMRAGYRMILEPQPDIEVVGEASCGEDALPQIRRLKPDVVLCDLHMPGVSGLDITERLVKGQVGSKVVIVSVQVDGPMPQRLLDAGASGYWASAARPPSCSRPFEKSRAAGVTSAPRSRSSSPWAPSRARPSTCCRAARWKSRCCSARGLRAEEIARRLSLSGKTVATHKYRMFDKLGIKDTVALARMAAQHGVTEPTLVA